MCQKTLQIVKSFWFRKILRIGTISTPIFQMRKCKNRLRVTQPICGAAWIGAKHKECPPKPGLPTPTKYCFWAGPNSLILHNSVWPSSPLRCILNSLAPAGDACHPLLKLVSVSNIYLEFTISLTPFQEVSTASGLSVMEHSGSWLAPIWQVIWQQTVWRNGSFHTSPFLPLLTPFKLIKGMKPASEVPCAPHPSCLLHYSEQMTVEITLEAPLTWPLMLPIVLG